MTTDFYSYAHLVAAAIRIYEFQKEKPPSIESICQILTISLEQGFHLCRRLCEADIIGMVEGPFGTTLYIKDHLKIEDIPVKEQKQGIKEDLEKFKNTKKNISEKIESFQAEQAKKQKDLFAEIEKKLKMESEKR